MVIITWMSRNDALAILNLADERQLNIELADMVKETSEKRLKEITGHGVFVQVVINEVTSNEPVKQEEATNGNN